MLFEVSRAYCGVSVNPLLTWRRPGLTNRRVLLQTQRSRAVAPSKEDVTSVVHVKTDRKYVMVSGKGGVGKTSLSSSLAAKYASEGHDTLIVSTDPAHSLGDSLGQRLPGGKPVAIEGTALPIWGMEIDPDLATEEFKSFASTSGKEKVQVRFK
jgi:phosphate starvation-inducible protein PhoH